MNETRKFFFLLLRAGKLRWSTLESKSGNRSSLKLSITVSGILSTESKINGILSLDKHSHEVACACYVPSTFLQPHVANPDPPSSSYVHHRNFLTFPRSKLFVALGSMCHVPPFLLHSVSQHCLAFSRVTSLASSLPRTQLRNSSVTSSCQLARIDGVRASRRIEIARMQAVRSMFSVDWMPHCKI